MSLLRLPTPKALQRFSTFLVFAGLSLLLHFAAVAWFSGRIELPDWAVPRRDSALQASISSPKIATVSLQPAQGDIKEPVKSTPRATSKTAVATARPKLTVPPQATNAQEVPRSNVSDAQPLPAQPGTDLSDRDPTLPPPAIAEVPEKLAEKPIPGTSKDDSNEPKDSAPQPNADAVNALLSVPRYGKALGPLPSPGAWSYRLFYGDYTEGKVLGRATFSLSHNNKDYKLQVLGKAEGLTAWIYSGEAVYNSQGMFGVNGFLPMRYAERSGKRGERVATVDYAIDSVNFGDYSKGLIRGSLDRVSVMWQIGMLLANDPGLWAAGRSIPVPLLSARSLELSQFVSNDSETLTTASGKVDTVHFKFNPLNQANKNQIDLWYSEKYLPLPVRVRWIDEKGTVLDFFRIEL